MKEKRTDVGIIVGRFQVPYLTSAHIELIDSVVANHPKVIMFLGLAPVLVTRNNPLDFDTRKKMILDRYPDITVLYIKDIPSDKVWTNKLDEQISDMVPNQSATLYGGRDGFISHYNGKFKTVELEAKQFVSGTELRNSISKSVKQTQDFRTGVIWAAYNQYPKVYTTVDIAIMSEKEDEVLLGRKPNETKYQFIGGFTTPDSECFEYDAVREASEETGAALGNMEYICSMKINDWRYRNEVDKIKTVFFKSKYIFGPLKAGDDIAEIRWFKMSDLVGTGLNQIMDGHKPLLVKLQQNLGMT